MQNKATLRFPIALITITCLYSNAFADKLYGKVVKVVDGDTIYVLDSNKTQHKIRLAGIDAPEKNQPFGKQSRKHLEKLLTLTSYQVLIVHEELDRYGRIIGTVFAEPATNREDQTTAKDLNNLMVRNGYAWAYRKYSEEYTPMENLARKERAGLWADPNPVPPWEWRKRY